ELGLPGVAEARDEMATDILSPEDSSYFWGTFAYTAIQTLTLPDSVQEISSWCILGANIQQLCLGKDYIGSINAFHPENNISDLNDQYNVGSLCLYDLLELKEIKVAEDNSCYMVKDDLLYSKDGAIVYGCPYGKKKVEIVLDKTVRQIAPYAFYHNLDIDIITCQGSLVSIGKYAFYGSYIRKFLVNGDVAYIQDYAFCQSEIYEFSTMGNVYSIGDYAFHFCEYLNDAKLQVGGRLYEMTPTAFFHYISIQRIKKILVPDFLKQTKKQSRDSIDAVVEKWKALQEIYKNQNNQCGETAYWKLEGDTLVVYGTGNVSEKINLLEGDAEDIRRLVIEEGITGITGQRVFSDLYSIRYVELPDSLETIAAFAFNGLTQMSKIQIPKNVNQIGEGAFYGIFCLKKIQVDPDNKTYVSQDGVLFSRDMRTLVQFPGGKDSVNADSDWDGIYLVPNTVTEMGPLSFAGTHGLEKVILPETLRILGGGAFYDSNIEEINLQDTQVTELPAYNGWKWKVRDHFHKEDEQPPEEEVYYYWGTFEYSRLYHLVLPDGVKEISSVCFRNSKMRKITLGASYCGLINQRKLSWETYEGEESAIKFAQDNLAESILLYSDSNSLLLSQGIQEGLEVDISPDNPNYQIKDGVIYNRSGTITYGLSSHIRTDIVLEETVKEIAPAAFWGEAYLQTVSVPCDLESIGAGAFAESGLREIRVNGRVGTIEAGAFAGSVLARFDSGGVSRAEDYAFAHTYLSAIDLGKEVRSLGKGVFRDCYALQTVSFDGAILFLPPDLFTRCPSLRSVSYPLEALAINSCLKTSLSLY
nr:leucine-rich repeat domain-containing protein [Lachnospiraceae bacterium]